MKTKKTALSFNKTTISNLDDKQLDGIRGGTTSSMYPTCITVCDTHEDCPNTQTTCGSLDCTRFIPLC